RPVKLQTSQTADQSNCRPVKLQTSQTADQSNCRPVKLQISQTADQSNCRPVKLQTSQTADQSNRPLDKHFAVRRNSEHSFSRRFPILAKCTPNVKGEEDQKIQNGEKSQKFTKNP
ncbi:MAG: hypothetical protein IJD43_11220, partial [Thermoguttaceae bacterium]|nr:hypothetical protein [Thermoguttaceae bacterium]